MIITKQIACLQIPRSNEGKEWWFYVDKEMTAEILEGKYCKFGGPVFKAGIILSMLSVPSTSNYRGSTPVPSLKGVS